VPVLRSYMYTPHNREVQAGVYVSSIRRRRANVLPSAASSPRSIRYKSDRLSRSEGYRRRTLLFVRIRPACAGEPA